MKCPRCGSDMKRQKQADHTFIYYCPVCKYEIGKKREEMNQDQPPEEEMK